jgi:glycine cleavage system H lipoate-binding protein
MVLPQHWKGDRKMEGYNYVDLFATKGMEYVLVIGFLLAFILFWRYLSRPVRLAGDFNARGRGAARLTPWFNLADGIFYHQGHSWAMHEYGRVVRVGMDDFAQKLLGRSNSVDLPQVGAKVEQGEAGWKLHVDTKSVDLLSPVDGEVIALNEEVLKNPDLINHDPYGKGWLMKIRVPKMKANLKNLLSGKVANAWMEQNVEALRRMMTGDVGVVLQDGGLPVTGFARNLSPDNWDEVVKEFLLTK